MPERTAHVDAREEGSSVRLGWLGRLGAPLIAILVYLLLPAGEGVALSAEGRSVAAIGVLMALLWMTEALPLPATALLPLALFPLAGALPMADAAAPYAHKYIFLFMGGFMIALAMERWSLHKRIALTIVGAVGTKPTRLIAGFMAAAALLSMWISNTATAVMLLPIATSIIGLVQERMGSAEQERDARVDRFGVCLLISVAYACTVGGVGTIIGTPPNVFLVSYLDEAFDIQISFFDWMLAAIPLVVVFLTIIWLALTKLVFRIPFDEIPGGRAVIREELARLGPLQRAEKMTLAVFALAAMTWIGRGFLAEWAWFAERVPLVTRLDDAAVAIIAALLLFALPVDPRRGVFVLDWDTAKGLPWGVLLLFGGGLSLSAAIQETGLDAFIGAQVEGLGGLPTVLLIAAVALIVILLTEFASNTAVAAIFLPVLGGVAPVLGMDPLQLCIPAAVAASCAFMMPVATPPNAIIFGSGRVRITQLVRAGVLLNLVSVVLVTVFAYTTLIWALVP